MRNAHRGTGGEVEGGRGRGHQQREHQEAAGDLAGTGRGDAEHQQEQPGDESGRDAVDGGGIGVDRGPQQWPPDRGQHDQARQCGDEQHVKLLGADPGDGAEQQAGQPGQESVIEADEQEPGRQCEGLNRADPGGLLTEAAQPARLGRRGQQRDRRRGADAGREVAVAGGHAEPGRGGGAGETDDGQGVPGEAFLAQHHHPADNTGENGDDGAGAQRGDHERVGPHLLHIGDQIPGQLRIHPRAPSTCMAGTSGWPTTNRRPARSWSTSIGMP